MTTIPFGPVLLGQTEKTLNALLGDVLVGVDLTERQWVTLRVAALSTDVAIASDDELAAHVRDRARFADAAALVADLTARGLVADGRPTVAGHSLLEDVLARSARATGNIWEDLPADDVAAATRVLNVVLDRARALAG